MRSTTLFSALAALSMIATTAPAAAETQIIKVSYEDLDLTRPSGLAALNGRIHAAAKKICSRADVRKVLDGKDQRRCMQVVRSSTAIQIAQATNAQPVLALNSAAPRP